jgi:hypothetical protein
MILTKEADMGPKRRKPTAAIVEAAPAEGELPSAGAPRGRASSSCACAAAELLDAVSRESRVPAHELESWKRASL